MSNSDLVQYIVEQASKGGEVSAKKMFGDYCLYCDSKPVGLICDILCRYYYRKRNPVPIMVGHAFIDLATSAQILATSTIPGLYETMCGL